MEYVFGGSLFELCVPDEANAVRVVGTVFVDVVAGEEEFRVVGGPVERSHAPTF